MKDIINERYKYSQLTGKIIGCSMEVHKILGNGFQEVIIKELCKKSLLFSGSRFSGNLK
jgi:hypothetical protein